MTRDAVPDVVVVGSGAAALTAALVARIHGLEVLVLEKDRQVGGTTAISGGGIWVPASTVAHRKGIADTLDAARTYFRAVTGRDHDARRAEAFISAAPAMIEFLESKAGIRFVVAADRPDYYPDEPGGTNGGRMLLPASFDARDLGVQLDILRPPLRETTFLGMMMRPASDLRHFLNVFRSFESFAFVTRRLFLLLLDKIRHGRSMDLAGGNALIAHLLKASLDAGVVVRTSSHVTDLLHDDGRIRGVRCRGPAGDEDISARLGVVLAAGGFPHDIARRKLRYPHAPTGTEHRSPAPAALTGDGIRMAERMGAHVPELADAACWAPVSVVRYAGGREGVFPHLIDRQKPGFIAVTGSGHRFANESHSYHEFGRGLIAAGFGKQEHKCFLVADHKAIRRYGIGFAKPAPVPLFPYLRSGYLIRGRTLRELAQNAGIDPDAFVQTVETFNSGARDGKDTAYGRGSSAYNRYTGDPHHQPNPCVAPLENGPFYAVRIEMGELGTFEGVATDEFARVLKRDGTPIDGLYAAGNDMSHVMGGHYIGGGSGIGPAMTFGYIAARHLAGSNESIGTPMHDQLESTGVPG